MCRLQSDVGWTSPARENSRWADRLIGLKCQASVKKAKSKRKQRRTASVPLNCSLVSVCHHMWSVACTHTSTQRSVSVWRARGQQSHKKNGHHSVRQNNNSKDKVELRGTASQVEKSGRKVFLNGVKLLIASRSKYVGGKNTRAGPTLARHSTTTFTELIPCFQKT